MLSSYGVHTNQTDYYKQINSSYVARRANRYFSAGGIFHSSRRVTYYQQCFGRFISLILIYCFERNLREYFRERQKLISKDPSS